MRPSVPFLVPVVPVVSGRYLPNPALLRWLRSIFHPPFSQRATFKPRSTLPRHPSPRSWTFHANEPPQSSRRWSAATVAEALAPRPSAGNFLKKPTTAPTCPEKSRYILRPLYRSRVP